MSWKTTLASFLLRYVAPTAIDIAKRKLSPAPFDVDTPLYPIEPARARVRRSLAEIISDERTYLEQVESRDTQGYSPSQLDRLHSQVANIRARVKMYEERLAAESSRVAPPE